MVRRFICSLAIVATTGVGALIAAERATFILVTGERKSGPVVFHGGERENLINGMLNLGDDSNPGKEMTFPVDQVTMIQFQGGRPPVAELEALPQDGQAMVRRNGTVERGRFINIIGGDTVKWQAQNGDQQMIPIGDVARIYLKPDSARTTFNVTNRSNPNVAVATSGTVLEPGAVRVEANQQWNSTGLNVRAGDLVAFRATGRINFGQGATQTSNADGNDSLRSGTYPVAVVPVGALIGRVGASAPFPIGTNTQPIRMPSNGTLMLGVNDDAVGDNSGFFSVVVTRQ